MTRIHSYIILVVIIAASVFGFLYFQKKNKAILAEQEKIIATIEQELVANIDQINQDLNNELITPEKAQERFQAEYEKYQARNSELYNETIEKMKIKNIFN